MAFVHAANNIKCALEQWTAASATLSPAELAELPARGAGGNHWGWAKPWRDHKLTSTGTALPRFFGKSSSLLEIRE